MSLETSVVSVTITRATLFPTRQGFGIPLLLAYHTRTPNLIDYYTSLQGMIDDGFFVTDTAYRMAVVAFSQNPHPTKVVIGRRTHSTIMIVKILPKNLTVGFTYSLTYVDATGLATDISYVVQTSDTAVIIGTALQVAIDALASSSAAVNGSTGEVTITASTTGVPFNLKNLPYLTDLHVVRTDAANNIVNDYNACKAVDGSTWYGVAIDSNCEAEIEALAAQIETEKKLFIYETSDSDCADNAVSSDVMSDLKTSNYARTAGIFAQREIASYRSVGWLSKGLAGGAQNPGGTSWSFLGLNGVAVDTLISEGSLAKIIAKRGNVYVNMGGLAQTYSDLVADNEHIDLIVGTDWLYYSLLTDVLGLFYTAANNNSKLPYTDSGAAMIQTAVLARLNSATPSGKGQQATFLADLPAPTCTVPKVATVDPAVRADRQLPDVKFTATLAGAINSVVISGTLSV
jgi:hypothetical protein